MNEVYSADLGSEQMEMMYPDLKAKTSSRTQRRTSANIHKNKQLMEDNDKPLSEVHQAFQESLKQEADVEKEIQAIRTEKNPKDDHHDGDALICQACAPVIGDCAPLAPVGGEHICLKVQCGETLVTFQIATLE